MRPAHSWGLLDVEYHAGFPFFGAGCMFVNKHHTLVAIHSKRVGGANPKTLLSGFGGKREAEESWKQTAFRETLEEIFGVRIPKHIFDALFPRLLTLVPTRVLCTELPRGAAQGGGVGGSRTYLTLVYTFHDLERFLDICRPYILRLPSTAYPDVYPKTAADIVMKRTRFVSFKDEIRHIVLWPRYAGAEQDYWISHEFMGDLSMVNHGVRPSPTITWANEQAPQIV